MKMRLSTAACLAALVLSAGAAMDAGLSPAVAQVDVSFRSFHDQLAPYGDWVYSDRWGEVWIPEDVSDDFRPYGTNGRWVYTEDYGWYWVSDYDWGDIPFHYGRWVNDPDDGWLWIPGYVWGPGWVVWRHNGEYTGWMPMPPDDRFLGYGPETTSLGISIGGLSISFSSGDDYGYRRWYGRDYDEDRFASNWIFIGTRYMGDRDYRRYEAPRRDYVNIIHNTTNITNYKVVNNYVVNRSVDPNAVRRAGGHIKPVNIANVVRKPELVTNVNVGREMQMRAREMRPHGNGMANSAPKPTPQQIQTLSTKVPHVRGGKAPVHLFSRETITKAQLPPAPKTNKTIMGPSPAATGPSMTGPRTAKPGAAGPEALSPEEKFRGKERGKVNGPMMNGPGMNGPAAKGSGFVQPGGPTMTGPAMPPPEIKKRGKVHGPENGPMMLNGPATNGPTMEPGSQVPTREHVRRPAVIGPASPNLPAMEKHPRNIGPAATIPPPVAPGIERSRKIENPSGPVPHAVHVIPPAEKPTPKEEKQQKKPKHPDGGH